MADTWRSKNLIYNALEAEDAVFIHRLLSHSETVLRNSPQVGRPRDHDDAKAWVEESKTMLLSVLICLPASGNDTAGTPTPVGRIGLRYEARMDHHRHATLGVMIMHQHQGKGYGSEAIRWILDWGFRMANLHRIELHAFSWNPRAVALYERLGFVHEGRTRERYWFDGAYHDELTMGMLDREWKAMSSAGAGRRDSGPVNDVVAQ